MDIKGILDAVIKWFENIDIVPFVQWIKGLTPLDLLTQKWLLGIALLICAILFFFRALRALSLIVGAMALWGAKTYLMPGTEIEISLIKLISFAIICLFVGILWIYMFFIRGD